MKDKDFDHIINRALNNFEDRGLEADWDSFSKKFEDDLNSDISEFDEIIQEKMSSYEVNLPEGAWASFDHKMTKSLYEEYAMELDQTVRESFDNFKVPYDYTTWPILERKLEEHKAYIRKLVFTKSIEAAIIIFAIFTFYTYFPHFHQQFKNWKEEGSTHDRKIDFVLENNEDIKNEESVAFLNTDKPQNIIQSTVVHEETITEKTDLVTNTADSPSSAEVLQDKIRVDNSGSDRWNKNPIRRANPSSEIAPIASINIKAPVSGKSINRAPIELMVKDLVADKNMVRDSEGVEDVTKGPEYSDLENRRSNVSLNRLNNSLAVAASDQAFYPSFNDLNIRGEKPKWSIAIYGSKDINFVNIPQDQKTDYYNNRALVFAENDLSETGFGFGLSAQRRFGDFAVESGFNYSAKNYDPNKNYSPGGYPELEYKHIGLEVLRIPLNLKYYLGKDGRVQLYALAGSTLNAVVRSYHDIIIPQPRFLTSGSNNNIPRPIIERVKTDFLETEKQDIFITMHLGVGLEYALTNEYSLFFEPTYEQLFSSEGIGPNNDRINTASFKLGSRMNF